MTDLRVTICPILAAAVLLGACAAEDAPAVAQTPPAKVENPIRETDLTTVMLTAETETRLGVMVEPVARRAVPTTRMVAGVVVVPPGMTLDVTAPVTGMLAGDVPQAGRLIRRGDVLFRLVPLLPAERDLRINAERELTAARAALEAAQKKTARAEQLLQDGSGSRRAAEEARAELAVAEAAAKAADERMAVVNRGRINEASEVVVTAPIDGIVEMVSAAPGQTVAASAKLLQVTRLDRLWVRAAVYAGTARDLDLDRGAELLRLGEPSDAAGLPARRVAAPPSATPAASAIDVTFEVPAGSGLQPGERVHVRLAGRTAQTATVIPQSALLHDVQGGTWVYERTAPHVFTRRRVEVQDAVGGLALLARGPQAGAPIVTTGAAELFGIEFGAGK